jgi:hypothetical protein
MFFRRVGPLDEARDAVKSSSPRPEAPPEEPLPRDGAPRPSRVTTSSHRPPNSLWRAAPAVHQTAAVADSLAE